MTIAESGWARTVLEGYHERRRAARAQKFRLDDEARSLDDEAFAANRALRAGAHDAELGWAELAADLDNAVFIAELAR